MQRSDILIIGTGIAGLSFAIKTALQRKDLHITLIAKDKAEAGNTKYAQGGIAVVMDTLKDSFEQHIHDTILAGGGLCDDKIVTMVVEQAPERLQELLALGVRFDKDRDKNFSLALEGGHSVHRIVHHGDMTGLEIERSLLKAVREIDNITLLEDHFVIDLVMDKQNDRCIGAWYLDDEGCANYFRSRITVLCTGGCGQLFRYTTNPCIATGDGVAIAYRAGAKIADMHYIQFHPTALYEPGQDPYFLLTEALRGFGAHVVNEEGRFLFQYDIRGELATRDIVSKAIWAELHRSGRECVYLDCRHLDPGQLDSHFPSILSYCRAKGIDPMADLLPIVPAAHYQCGGITVDEHARTSVNGLFAIGECARTGLHGRNRLASNSLLEAVVFAHQASVEICSTIDGIAFSAKVYSNKYPHGTLKKVTRKIDLLRKEVKQAMEDFYFGDADVKNAAFLKIHDLKTRICTLQDDEGISVKLMELTNMTDVALVITEHHQQNAAILRS